MSWESTTSPEFDDYGFQSVSVDPRDADVVWAGGYSRVFVTHDGGRSWSLAGGTFLPGYVLQLRFDPANPDRLYAASDSALYVSDRGGPFAVQAFSGDEVTSVAIDPRDSEVLLAAVRDRQTSTSRVWRSVDRGATWHVTLLRRQADAFRDLVFDPARAGTAYLLTGDLVYRSADGGLSWSPLTRGLRIVHELLPSPSGRLYATGSPFPDNYYPLGVVRSDDGGTTWTQGAAPFDQVYALVRLPGVDDLLLAAGEEGLWRSGAGGRSWSASSVGVHWLYAASLTVQPVDGALFANFGFGSMASRDGGGTWKRTTPRARHPQGWPALGDPSRAGVLYDPYSQLRSLDGGSHWIPMRLPGVLLGSYPYNTYIPGFAADPSNPGTLYTEGYSGIHNDVSPFFLKSGDYGATWTSVRFPPFETLSDWGSLAVGAGGTVYVSVAGIAGRLYRSDDGGRHWQTVGAGLPPKNGAFGISALVADPEHAAVIYAIVDGRVFASKDSGAHFHAQSLGLPTGDLGTLVVDPRTGGLFAGVANVGVFAWDRDAQRWQRLDAGLPPLNGTYGERFRGALALDSEHGWLFASTNRGIYRLTL